MRDVTAILPAKVAVRFRARRCSGDASADYPRWYLATVELADVFPDVGAGFDGTKMFHDAALALFNAGGTDPTNKTALDDLAKQIAKDYWGWLQTSFDEVFPEIIAPTPSGLTDLIEWGYEIDRVWTRRVSAPYNAYPEELAHHDPANADCEDDLEADPPVIVTPEPCLSMYGPGLSGSSGSMVIPLYRVCLEGGRLVQRYVRTETIGCGCGCSPGTTKICGRINSSCGGVVAGVTVESTGPSESESKSTISAVSDSSGNYCLNVPYAGTWPVVAHTPCGDVSQNVNVSCGATVGNVNFTAIGHNLRIEVTSNCENPTSAYYTLTRPGQPIVRPALPLALPVTYCLQPGDYIFSFVDNDCYADTSIPITMGCAAQTLTPMIPAKTYTYGGNIQSACGGIQGATLVASGPGISKTVTSDSNGNFLFTDMPALCEFTISASKDRYTTQTFPSSGTLQVSCFNNGSGPTFGLSPAPGYECFAQCCREPLKLPMPVSDSLGEHTITRVGTVLRSECIFKTGVTVTCPCGTIVEDGSVAYYYILTCENVTGKITLTRVMLGCVVGSTPYPVQSGCDGSGNLTSTCTGFGSLAEGSEVTPGRENCGPLSHEFNFSVGWSDSATINA